MSIASVVLRGYTAEGSMPLVVTRGYSMTAASKKWGRKPTIRDQDEKDLLVIMQFIGENFGRLYGAD